MKMSVDCFLSRPHLQAVATIALMAALSAPGAFAQVKPQLTPDQIINALAPSGPSQAPAAGSTNCPDSQKTYVDGIYDGCAGTKGTDLGFNVAGASSAQGGAKGTNLGFNVAGASGTPAKTLTASKPVAPKAAKPVKASSVAAYAPAQVNMLITFESGSSVLTPQGLANADAFATAMQDPRMQGKRILIAGHTDAVGSRSYNQSLSQQRAEAVKSYLTSKGVDATALEAKGFGEDHLKLRGAPTDAANRRVEASVL